MKRVRITYESAFHHIMNRGINGEEIFSCQRTKSQFLDFTILPLKIVVAGCQIFEKNLTVHGSVGKILKLLYNMYMRRERITYPGAYHHVMNRGYDGDDIFFGNQNKSQFLDYLEGACNKMMIRLFAYCVMDKTL